MNYWILPSNEKVFRLNDFLKTHNVVDWVQKNNFEVGDTVFIYNSKPEHRITHQMTVERVDVPSVDYIDDKDFWVNTKDYETSLKGDRFVRFRLVAIALDDSNIKLEKLREKGLNGNLQSAIKFGEGELRRYILTQMQPDTQEKVCRICWNTCGWERPSGVEGKSTSLNAYEAQHGFGHEEWLLDRRKIMPDGYHYGFLEPLRKSSFEGRKDIHLYTFCPDGRKLYVGCIHNAEYVGLEKADEVWEEYISRGWADSMKNELKDCGLQMDMTEHFNVRFKFEEFVDYSGRNIFLRKDDPNTRNSRYMFIGLREPFLFESLEAQVVDNDAEAISDPNNKIPEGAKSRVIVNRYERSYEARQACLAAKGYTCQVCGMNFEEVYGEMGRDFIHVHHIVPISEIGQSYQVDPIKDLVPVCPNCHAMLHKGIDGRVLTVEELKKIIKEAKNKSK